MSEPFVIGVIAGLSGSGRSDTPFVDVDRDELDAVLARLAPGLELEPFGRVELRRFADLHPDGLVDCVPALAELVAARDAMSEPERMREHLVRAGVAELAEDASAQDARREAPLRTMAPELLDAILERRPLAGALRVVSTSRDPEFERLVADVVDRSGSRVERSDSAQRERWREAIERELGARVRRLLHAPGFRRLESAWRSLHELCRGVETGDDLRIRVLALSQQELAEELEEERPLEQTRLHRLVFEHPRTTGGGESFGLLVTDFAVGASGADERLLAHLAAVAGRAAVPCLAALAPSLWSEEAIDWDVVSRLGERARKLEGAERLGLCCPRLLTRAAYGRGREEVDRFAFEEHPDGPSARECVWGSAAFAIAAAAAQAFRSFGSASLAPRLARLERLPYEPGVGSTDRLLTDREAERLSNLGLMPVAAERGSDAASIRSFRSLAGTPLF